MSNDSNIIRITRHHSTKVHLRINDRPEVVIPVGPIFDLDSVDQYTPDEIRGVLDDSDVGYESVDAGASVGAASAGGFDALAATHPKPDPSVSATMTTGIKVESDDRKDELQMKAYGGELEEKSGAEKSDADRVAGATGARSDDAAAARRDEEQSEKDREAGTAEKNEQPSDERREELLALLDQNVPDLIESMKGRSAEDLLTLRQAEKDGKSRKSALEAIELALDAVGDDNVQ